MSLLFTARSAKLRLFRLWYYAHRDSTRKICGLTSSFLSTSAGRASRTTLARAGKRRCAPRSRRRRDGWVVIVKMSSATGRRSRLSYARTSSPPSTSRCQHGPPPLIHILSGEGSGARGRPTRPYFEERRKTPDQAGISFARPAAGTRRQVSQPVSTRRWTTTNGTSPGRPVTVGQRIGMRSEQRGGWSGRG